MPLPAWAITLGLQGLGLLGKGLLNPEVETKFEITPQMFKDELTLSDSDLSSIRAANLRNLSMLNSSQARHIKQVGSARRMPSGAILSNLAGSSLNLSKGASMIEPHLRRMQVQSYGDYLRLLQPYLMLKARNDMQNQLTDRTFLQQGFGDMAKLFILKKAGFFNSPE